MTDHIKALFEMDVAIKALVVELPAKVWDDVNARWQALRPFLDDLPILQDDEEVIMYLVEKPSGARFLIGKPEDDPGTGSITT